MLIRVRIIEVFAVLFIHTYVNSSHEFILFLLLNKNLIFEKEHEYLQIKASLLSPRGLEMINYMGKVMVDASMYPASRIVVKTIKCEYTSILDNILLLKTLR